MSEERFALANAINRVDGYYRAPSPSDKFQSNVEDRFFEAKNLALTHMAKAMKDVEDLTIEQFLPKYRKTGDA